MKIVIDVLVAVFLTAIAIFISVYENTAASFFYIVGAAAAWAIVIEENKKWKR